MCTGQNPWECFTLLFKSLIPKVLNIELGKQRPVKVNMEILPQGQIINQSTEPTTQHLNFSKRHRIQAQPIQSYRGMGLHLKFACQPHASA